MCSCRTENFVLTPCERKTSSAVELLYFVINPATLFYFKFVSAFRSSRVLDRFAFVFLRSTVDTVVVLTIECDDVWFAHILFHCVM